MFVTDFYDIAINAQHEIGVDMYLDAIFSEHLNAYFNYKYDYANDVITLNFEVDDGTATLDIVDSQTADYSYKMNSILTKYIEESRKQYC